MRITPLLGLIVLGLAGSLVGAEESQRRVISREELEDKVEGYWVGQLVGNYFGFPFELVYEGPVPVDVTDFHHQRNVLPGAKINDDWRGNLDQVVETRGGARSDDDHDLEWLQLMAIEKYGLDITYPEIATELDEHVKGWIWVSTEHAIQAIRDGEMPPGTGRKENNPYWTDLMASISTEIWGSFYPGMTDKAADGAEWFGRITNDDWALHLARFYSAMHAAAFFEDDYAKLLEIGKAQVPEDNMLHKGINDVEKWCRTYPRSEWRKTCALIYEHYYNTLGSDDRLKRVTDALPNGLLGIMAFIYAEGDFKEALSLSTSAGADSDNQPATLGGLIGVMKGYEALPEDYRTVYTDDGSSFYGTYINETREGLPERESFESIVTRICDVAEKAILANGGEKGTDDNGEVFYRIVTDF